MINSFRKSGTAVTHHLILMLARLSPKQGVNPLHTWPNYPLTKSTPSRGFSFCRALRGLWAQLPTKSLSGAIRYRCE